MQENQAAEEMQQEKVLPEVHGNLWQMPLKNGLKFQNTCGYDIKVKPSALVNF